MAGVGADRGYPFATALASRRVIDRPREAPLSTPRSLPFHASGSQTSTLMSESGVGVAVAMTRQNAGTWNVRPDVNSPAG